MIISSCGSTVLQRNNATIILKAKEILKFDFYKSSANLTIENLSDSEISILSNLKTKNFIKPSSIFKYRVPKKGKMEFFNPHNKCIQMKYLIVSKSEFKMKITK